MRVTRYIDAPTRQKMTASHAGGFEMIGGIFIVLRCGKGRQFSVMPRTVGGSGNLPCFILTNDFFLSDLEAVRQCNYKVERNVGFKTIEDLVELGDLVDCHCCGWLVGWLVVLAAAN